MNSYNRYLHARIAADINLLKLQLFKLVAYSTSTFGPMAALSGSPAVQPHIWQMLIHNLTNLGIATSQLMHTPISIYYVYLCLVRNVLFAALVAFEMRANAL